MACIWPIYCTDMKTYTMVSFSIRILSEKRVLIKNSERMRKIEAIIRSEKSEEIIERLRQTGIEFLSLTVGPVNDSEQIIRQQSQQGMKYEYQQIGSGYSFPPISYKKRNIS